MAVKLTPKAYKVAHYLYPKANLERGDIRNYESPMKMDYSVGNPPFNLAFNFQNESILSQLYFCQKSAQVLKPLGIMAIIVPMSFLADTFSDKHMIEQLENDFSFLGQFFYLCPYLHLLVLMRSQQKHSSGRRNLRVKIGAHNDTALQ